MIAAFGHEIRGLLKEATLEYERDYARYFGTAMVYHALVSLIPLLVLILAALGAMLQVSEVVAAAEQRLLDQLATSFGLEVRATIEPLLRNLEEQSRVASIVSLAALLFTVSTLLHHLRMTFRAIWHLPPPWLAGSVSRAAWSTVREKAIAIVMACAGSLLMFAVIFAFVALHWMDAIFGRYPPFGTAQGWLLLLPFSSLVVFLVFVLLLRHLPPVRLPLRQVWVAAVLCTAVWLVGLEALALYGRYFGRVSAYGAVGGVFMIMLWMNMIGRMLLYGAELSKVIALRERAAATAGEANT